MTKDEEFKYLAKIMGIENNVFYVSLNKCQAIVDIMLEHKNKDGICIISQLELSQKLSKTQTNISKSIRLINVEDKCIEMVSPGRYIVHYKDLLEHGTFLCIKNLIIDTTKDPQLLIESVESIAARYGYKPRTVQMFKAYMTTGNVK